MADENTITIEMKEAGQRGSASSVSPDDPADFPEGVRDVPQYQREFDTVIGRVAKGLLTFDEGLERVEKILSKYREEITDFHRDAGDRRSFDEISTSARKRVGHAASGDDPTAASATGESRQKTGDAQAKAARDAEATAFLRKIGLGYFSQFLPKSSGQTNANEDESTRRIANIVKTMAFIQASGGIGGKGQTASGMVNAAVGVASTGVLGEGAAALAGGPAGLIAIAGAKIADMLADHVQEKFRDIQKTIRFGGDVAKGMVNNDPLAVVNAGAEKVADTLEKIPVVGKVFAEGIRTATVALNTFAEVVSAITSRARELAKYDGRIAQSAANADVQNIMLDIEEANRLGDAYAKMIDSEQSLRADFREIMMPLKEFLINTLADILKGLSEMMKSLKPAIEAGVTATVTTAETVKAILPFVSPLTSIASISGKLLKEARANNDRETEKRIRDLQTKGQTAMEMLFTLASRASYGLPAGMTNDSKAEERGLNVPIVGGA